MKKEMSFRGLFGRASFRFCREWRRVSHRRLWKWGCVLTMLGLLVVYRREFLMRSNDVLDGGVRVTDPRLPVEERVHEGPVEALIHAIQVATRAAGGGKATALSKEEILAWERNNRCQSREELWRRYAQRQTVKDVDKNPQWAAVLDEYAVLHRTCMHQVGNVSEAFVSKSSSGCKFLVVDNHEVGLGNKVVLLSSAVLYAILTQRVILVPEYSYIPQIMCEPFLGSSWILDKSFPLPGPGWENTFLGKFFGWESSSWKSNIFFEKGVDNAREGKPTSPLYAMKIDHSHPEKKRFFCNTEQAYLTQVTWAYFQGWLYFLPKLFAIPTFQTPLEALFPDPSLALTYILRSVILPSDNVWNEVKKKEIALFKDAHVRVGIQVRFLWGRGVKFRNDGRRINSHVEDCAVRTGILPDIIPESALNKSLEISEHRKSRSIQVLITSLHTSLYEDLIHKYSGHETVGGDIVRVAQISHRGKQSFSANEDAQALVEILLLSFVDNLIVTPLSTFGGLAQAYGRLTPWMFETKVLRRYAGSCVRAQSVDLCYQRAEMEYNCPHNPEVDKASIEKAVPYIKRCLFVEESDGIQLMPTLPGDAAQTESADIREIIEN